MSDRIRMTIDAAFNHGDSVRHKTGDRETDGIVVAIVVTPHGVLYRIAWHPGDDSEHYELELERVDAKAET